MKRLPLVVLLGLLLSIAFLGCKKKSSPVSAPGPVAPPAATSTPTATGTLPATDTPTPSATATETPTAIPGTPTPTPTTTHTDTPTHTGTPTFSPTVTVTVPCPMGDSFGLDTGANGVSIADQTIAFRVTVPSTGVIYQMKVNRVQNYAGNYTIQAGVYADNGTGTSPMALLATSNAQVPPSGTYSMVHFTLSNSLAVTAGQYLWLAVAMDPAGYVAFETFNNGGGAYVAKVDFGVQMGNPFTADFNASYLPRAMVDYCVATPTMTPTPTVTATPTHTPTACAGTAGSFGNNSGGLGVGLTNQTAVLRMTAPATGQIHQIRLNQVNAGSVQVGVYSDNGSGTGPDVLLASSGVVAAPGAPGNMTIPLSSRAGVVSGQYIWLAVNCVGSVGFDAYDDLGGTYVTKYKLGTPLPAPFGTSFDNDVVPRILADYCQ